MFHDFCQSVTLVFCQRTHVSHDHHPRGSCCSRARISYDEPCMGAIFYQKIFASALITFHVMGGSGGTGGKPLGKLPGGLPCMRNTTAWPRTSTFPGRPMSVTFIVRASPAGAVASVWVMVGTSSHVRIGG